jgi:RNA polymerase sigma-70 factor, ECF subfamily
MMLNLHLNLPPPRNTARSSLTAHARATNELLSVILCVLLAPQTTSIATLGISCSCSPIWQWGTRMIESAQAVTSDLELLKRMATGCVESFAAFYDRHSTLLFSIATNVLRDVHEAEEVLQDAARIVWENASVYNPSLGKPASWAVVITRNKAIDRLRVLQRRNAAIERLTADAEADFATRDHSGQAEVLSRESGELLRVALAELPTEQRLAIELAFFAGLSQTEVAAQLEQPLGTIKARIRRGMLTMRDVLEEQL